MCVTHTHTYTLSHAFRYLTPNMSQPTYGETMFYAPTKATTNPDDFETFEVRGKTPHMYSCPYSNVC